MTTQHEPETEYAWEDGPDPGAPATHEELLAVFDAPASTPAPRVGKRDYWIMDGRAIFDPKLAIVMMATDAWTDDEAMQEACETFEETEWVLFDASGDGLLQVGVSPWFTPEGQEALKALYARFAEVEEQR